MRLRAALAATALAAGLAACGTDHPTVATTPDEPGPHEVVIEVRVEGGFVPPEVVFGNTPAAVLFGDRTALNQGAMIEIYPGPAYVAMRRGRLAAAEVDRLLDLAESEHLTDRAVEAGQPPVADAPDTVLTIRARSGHTVVHRANALGMDDTGDSLTAAQRDARARLSRFVEAFESAVGKVTEDEFVPEGFRLRATPADPGTMANPDEPQPRVKPWPVDAVGLAGAADCLAVTGDAAADVRRTMQAADQLTFFTQAGTTYRVTVRPLLPNERGC